MDMSDLGTYIKNAITTKINALLPSQSGNSGKYLTTNGVSLSWGTVGSSTPIVNTSLTSLAIDCSIADVFRINLTANAAFVLSNLLNGKVSEIIIKNTATSIITITLPDNHAYRSKTYTIDAQLARVFSVRLVGTKYIWVVSEEISNA